MLTYLIQYQCHCEKNSSEKKNGKRVKKEGNRNEVLLSTEPIVFFWNTTIG
jgi:hypothetical protein